MDKKLCYYEGCNEKATIQGLCTKHYGLWLGIIEEKGKRGRSVEKRFWSFVWKPTKDGCWIWKGNQTSNGYGAFQLSTKISVRAHRFAWELHENKKIPKTFCVLHICDTPLCVNPLHLWLGSHTENMQDMVKKERFYPAIGESNGNHKLTEDEVLEIRQKLSIYGIIQNDIAKSYNVTPTEISILKYYKTWNYPEILKREQEQNG